MQGWTILAATAALAGADAPAAGGEGCSRRAVQAAAAAVRATRTDLMATPPAEVDVDVPPETGERIERLKDKMRLHARAEMACAPAEAAAGALGSALNEAAKVQVTADRTGSALLYDVRPVEGRPEMLAVVATLGIPCGWDSMLMLYGRSGGGWRELIVRRAPPYEEVRGGWEDLRFAVSPPDRDGRWFVATVSTTPWCSSSWQGLRYALARPASDPARPSVLLDGKTTTWLGSEQALLVRAGRDWFELRHTGSSLDPDVHSRRHVRRFAVEGDRARRVQPVAETARDFVDEWIEADWSEARAWSGSGPALASAHAAVKAARGESLRGFASVRGCGGALVQVAIAEEAGPGWFFLVRGGAGGSWTLEQAGRRTSPGCTAPRRRPGRV